MPYIQRILDIKKELKPGKVMIVYGPRRAGKSTLLEHFLLGFKGKYRRESGENVLLQKLLSSRDFSKILPFAKEHDLIAIDEAQLVPDIGKALKIIVDELPRVAVLATGSSSFDLAQQIGEPLTGRKTTHTLYPFSQQELLGTYDQFQLGEQLAEFLLYGTYPDVVLAPTRDEKIRRVEEIVRSYVFKDVLAMDRVRGSGQLIDLVKLLAFQVGNEVSLPELATQVGVSMVTVRRYLDILEQAFVIRRLGGYSKNLRKEITSKAKYYFIDNGVRNGITGQWNDLDNRNDVGALFENFVVMERIKKLSYEKAIVKHYFWRTYDQQEIDLIEERPNSLAAIEIKWGDGKTAKEPHVWRTAYPQSGFQTVNRDNYLDFVL